MLLFGFQDRLISPSMHHSIFPNFEKLYNYNHKSQKRRFGIKLIIRPSIQNYVTEISDGTAIADETYVIERTAGRHSVGQVLMSVTSAMYVQTLGSCIVSI